MSTIQETQTEETLKVVEQTSFDLDKKIWDSGLALSAWLQDHLLRHHTRAADNSVHPLIDAYLNRITTVSRPPLINVDNETDDGRARRTIRVVELGAGTGLVSFALASAVRRRWRNHEGRTAGEVREVVDKETPMAYEIYTTDLESALPLIDENAALNSRLWAPAPEAREVADSDTAKDEAQARDIMSGQDVTEPKIEIHSEVLDWEEDLPSWVHRDMDGHEVRIDIVIAADVTYNTASFPCLIKTLTSLLNPAPDTYINKPNTSGRPKESSPSPLLLLAYKERDASERELWELAKENGIWMELVDVIRGHEAVGQSGGVEVAGATEIWIGGMGERP
ncbi:hypothetical protein QFC22_002563 [Naganishia vaughanmartiniae]|uniref:Uncharacterized protein n=1 Tax=Naganishia vaughanmartiniae TaxID=1424756 RepID=A0ACC2XB44_9TREE|nr:hypothetical protein QFC22_002563 [Naganishia vaughanmartiniae]